MFQASGVSLKKKKTVNEKVKQNKFTISPGAPTAPGLPCSP